MLFEHLNGQRAIASVSRNNKTITTQQQQDVSSDVHPRRAAHIDQIDN